MKTKENSLPLIIGLLISLSAGLMDAYSFLCRGGVFANAQTGNIILLGINLSKGELSKCIYYLVPILAFGLGISLAFFALTIKKPNDKTKTFFILIFEAVILFSVSFFSQDNNLLANSLISFACGIQLEMFQQIKGVAVATTMCIGNFRLFIHNGLSYAFNKDKVTIRKAILYITVISIFVVGAIIGSYLIDFLKERAILGSSAVLLLAALFTLINKNQNNE